MPTVLVVDDNEKIVDVLAEYLEASGFSAGFVLTTGPVRLSERPRAVPIWLCST